MAMLEGESPPGRISGLKPPAIVSAPDLVESDSPDRAGCRTTPVSGDCLAKVRPRAAPGANLLCLKNSSAPRVEKLLQCSDSTRTSGRRRTGKQLPL